MIKDYILSIDTEFDGDIPGLNNLWSIGAALMKIESEGANYVSREIKTFEVHLSDLPGCTSNPRNMDFWEKHQRAWEYSRKSTKEPKQAIVSFDEWLKTLPQNYIVVTWPASSDIWFIEYYFRHFLGKPAFKGFPLDLRSYYFAQSKNTDWKNSGMDTLPDGWKPDNPGSHQALADAITQGHMACRIIIDNLK